LADLLEILREQRETGLRMAEDVPRMLADPEITTEQIKALFKALEQQAEFTENLAGVLEESGFDFEIVKAAEGLEELYAELAAAVAELLAKRGGGDAA
jgi:2-hydroxychromene-2-carboxylate isomerase